MSDDDDKTISLMQQTVPEGEDQILYSLVPPLHLESLKIILQDIEEKLTLSDSLKIDISTVYEIDFIAVQSFIAVNRFAITHHKNLQWLYPNDKFMDSFSKLGLYSEMMKMEFIS